MRRFSVVCWTVVVAALALALPAGGALADKPRNDGNPAAASKGKARGDHGKRARADGRAGPSKAATQTARGGKAKREGKANGRRGSAASRAGKVTICHATGSATNPFVTITVSRNATSGNGHGNHEDDLIPAPSGGCPAGAAGPGGDHGGDGNEKSTICHATGSETNPFVVITISVNGLNGHADHEDDVIPAPESGVCVGEAGALPGTGAGGGPGDTSPETTAPTGGPALSDGTAASGVEGTVASGGQAASGVLGTLASGAEAVGEAVVRGNLPFTGLPLWIAFALGVALLAAGIWIRARAHSPRLTARNQTGS